MYTKFITYLRNPKVQRLVLWAVPVVLAWIFDRSNKKASIIAANNRKIKRK